MNEEEVQAAIAAAVTAKEAELKKVIEDKEAALNGVVEELKNERKTKQQIADERDAALKAGNGNQQGAPDVQAQIDEAFAKREQERISVLREETIKKFKETHKEFHPDNDPGGIKYAAFEQKLSRINTNGLTSSDEFLGAFDDALALLNRGGGASHQPYNNPNASSSQYTPSPKSADANGLSSKEQELIKSKGWTEERYLKLKKSQPQFVESLLKN